MHQLLSSTTLSQISSGISGSQASLSAAAKPCETCRILVKEREHLLLKVQSLKAHVAMLSSSLQSQSDANRDLKQENDRIVQEVEQLSQKLFEEANRLVAYERRQLAEERATLRGSR
eukprot:jgi/Hompol1/2746/HPOL_000635-RA